MSPTASVDSIFLTLMIAAHEERDIMSTDISNAFIQADMPVTDERTIMKAVGVLVDILIKLNPTKYNGYVVYAKGKKVLYLDVLKTIYGMLQAALLWYKKFREDLISTGFIFNNYDPCTANKTVNGKQLTVVFHVDDCMSSHVEAKANDQFLKWLNMKYGEHGEVKSTRGNKHEYLEMTLIFENKELKVDMTDYVKNMLKEFPVKFNRSDGKQTVSGLDLFKVDDSKRLAENTRE